MDQLGWRTAWAGVTASISLRLMLRKGPPDAVRMIFSIASLMGGLAQSEAWLIAARAVQGLGAAIVSPAALSIITTTFAEGSERNRESQSLRDSRGNQANRNGE